MIKHVQQLHNKQIRTFRFSPGDTLTVQLLLPSTSLYVLTGQGLA